MSAAKEREVCGCGRESGYVVCSHVAAGGVAEISLRGEAATCSECEKLRPDSTFSPLCRLCLDRLSGPKNPQADLEKILTQEAEDRKILEEARARLHQREVAKQDLQRRLANDYIEALILALQDFVKMFKPGGHVFQRYEALQELAEKIRANDAAWPDSLSTDTYNDVIDRSDPEVSYLIDAVRNGSFGPEATLSVTLQRAHKNKSDVNPFWKAK